MRVLGICGSPKKDGNTGLYVRKALEAVTGPEVQTEIIELAGKKIADCNHCNWCLKNRDAGRICVQKDDGEGILRAIRDADVLVLASPVYYGRMTASLAALLDRTRPFLFSTPHRGCMSDKPGVALAVGWGRNLGGETTLLSLVSALMTLDMLPVSHHQSGAQLGAVGLSNPRFTGGDRDDTRAIEQDTAGCTAAQKVVQRAVDLARRIRPAP